MRLLPSMRALQVFASCVRLGSFAAAAAEHHLTASAVSHQMKALEQEIRQQLFRRVGRNAYPTETGQRYFNEIVEALGIIEQATQALSSVDAPSVVSVNCAPSLAALWLRPRLDDFHLQYPAIDVRLIGSSEPADLGGGEVDFDIRYGHVPEVAGIVVEQFPSETIVVACSPALALDIKAPSDLSRHLLIRSVLNMYGWRQWAKDHSVAVDLSRGTQFDRSLMSIASAVEGKGVCLESHLLLKHEIESGRLVLPFGFTGPKMVCHSLTYMRSRLRADKMTSFHRWIKNVWQDE